MTTRSRINALAVTILASGVLALSRPAAVDAATFDGCDDFRLAKLNAVQHCQSMGYQKMTYEGWCTSEGFGFGYSCG